MARPTKRGLDYFPIDIDMDQDDKLCVIEAKHQDGFKIIIKLLMEIYREGYFKAWSEQAALAFSGRKGIPVEDVTAVVETALQIGFFSQEMYERHGILTSAGIQRRYIGGAQGRERINLCTHYALVSAREFVDFIRKKLVFSDETQVSGQKTGVSWQTILVSGQKTQNGVSGQKTPVSGPFSTQREGGKKEREEREGTGGRETHNPPPAAPAGERPPAVQPATSGADPDDTPDLPEPAIPLDGLPPELRAKVNDRRRRTYGMTAKTAEPRAAPTAVESPELEPFEETP